MSLPKQIKIYKKVDLTSNHLPSYKVVGWSCDFCSQKFISDRVLQNHIRTEHFTTNGPLDKEDPEENNQIITTTKKSNKQEHQLLSCPQCDFTTPSSVVLRNHKLVHSYTKTCPYCSKKFFQDSHLKFHLTTHDATEKGIRPKIVPKSKILKRPLNLEPVATAERNVIEVKKETQENKNKKIKLEEEFLIESDPEIPPDILTSVDNSTRIEMLSEEFETEQIATTKEDTSEPLIQSICCDTEFQDLLSLLNHVHETHTRTFTNVMAAMQETLQGNRAIEQDEVVFVQFQTDDNGYSNDVYSE